MESVRPKTVKELVDDFRVNYNDNIKTLIETGDYEVVITPLETAAGYFDKRYGELLHEVHCGVEFLSSLVQLKNCIKNRDERMLRSYKMLFEAKLAQTSLPLR